VISGIEEVAYSRGFAVTISQSNDKLEKECKIAQTFFSNRVDGIIVSTGMETKSIDHLKLFSERKIPIVFFDRVVDEIEAHKIVVDDYGGSYRATQHLIEQGAKNIAHIGGPLNLKIYEHRQKGYCDALKDAGLKVIEPLIINISLSREEGTKAIEKLMQNEVKPDAVFCANDTSALSVIIYLKEHGIKIPQDIAIVGFSNEPFSEVVTPSISTIKQPGFMMGQKAALLIIQQILHDTENPVFKTIVMPTELIIRESSQRIK
jgi:LacI family transcriptional regulator